MIDFELRIKSKGLFTIEYFVIKYGECIGTLKLREPYCKDGYVRKRLVIDNKLNMGRKK